MSKFGFKPGQKLRRIGYKFYGVKPGDIVTYVKDCENGADVHVKECRAALSARCLEVAGRITKAQRLEAAAAKRAEDAAKRKAKAEREKVLKGLTPAGRRVAAMLHGNPEAFGCQKNHVIALVAALVGDSVDALEKALAK